MRYRFAPTWLKVLRPFFSPHNELLLTQTVWICTLRLLFACLSFSVIRVAGRSERLRESDKSWSDNVYFSATQVEAARAKVRVWKASQSGAQGLTIPPGFYQAIRLFRSLRRTDVHPPCLQMALPLSIRQRKPCRSSGSITGAAQALEEKIEHVLLVLWDDLPTWQRDNKYIQSGYRRASNSFWKSFASLGYIHNESVNIYSHLIGAMLFLVTSVVLYSTLRLRYETASRADLFAFGCFFSGVALCLGMSAAYHAFSNHSSRVASLGNKLDYVGIVLLIWGSFVASIYYGFYCRSRLQMVYWVMVRLALRYFRLIDYRWDAHNCRLQS